MVEPTQFKNISRIRSCPQVGVKIKNIGNHHLGPNIGLPQSYKHPTASWDHSSQWKNNKLLAPIGDTHGHIGICLEQIKAATKTCAQKDHGNSSLNNKPWKSEKKTPDLIDLTSYVYFCGSLDLWQWRLAVVQAKRPRLLELSESEPWPKQLNKSRDPFPHIWLVVEPTHLKNMLVKLDHFPK